MGLCHQINKLMESPVENLARTCFYFNFYFIFFLPIIIGGSHCAGAKSLRQVQGSAGRLQRYVKLCHCLFRSRSMFLHKRLRPYGVPAHIIPATAGHRIFLKMRLKQNKTKNSIITSSIFLSSSLVSDRIHCVCITNINARFFFPLLKKANIHQYL